MTVQIYNEDCLEGMKKIADGEIGFALIDPPYTLTDSRWDKGLDWERIWVEVKRILAPSSSVAVFAASKFTFELYATNPEMYRYKWYWLKDKPTNFVNAHNRPMNTLEEIMIFSNGVVAHAGKSKRRMKYFPQGLTAYKPRERVNYSKKKNSTYVTSFRGQRVSNLERAASNKGGGIVAITYRNTRAIRRTC